MSQQDLLLSEKYKAFIRHEADFEALEGVTAAGKTTVGIFKFMLKIAENPKKSHIIAAKTTGVAEKNIINKDLGIVDDFGALVEYNGNGNKDEKLPHILYHTNAGDKVIYILGYDTKDKWKNALGGQYGCLYIDEVNTADIDFVREATMRADYTMVTLNPDAPDLPVYSEYINHCRPLPEYAEDAPREINEMLSEEPKQGWTHWFFNFSDNLGLTEEKRNKTILSVPKGTKLYKNKILGLRGRATGLVFSVFDRKHHVVTKEWACRFLKRNVTEKEQQEYYQYFTAGLDTSYSSQSPDTIAMSFAGITNKGRYVLLSENVYNNADMETPTAPSDTVLNLINFLNFNRVEWELARNVFIDSADQATLTELAKYKRLHKDCIYLFNNAFKKVQIIDRINMQLGWMNYNDAEGMQPDFYVVDTCTNFITELETYSWKEDKNNEPEDGHDHMINSTQYGWIPYRDKIGIR